MKLKERVQSAWNAFRGRELLAEQEELLEWMGIPNGAKKKHLGEVTYYTCLKMLSETLGKLPLKYYQDTDGGRMRAAPTDMSYLLNVRPNSIMAPSTLWAATECNCQHYGNSYIWIQWEYESSGKFGGRLRPKSLWPMQANCVQVLMDDAGVFAEKGACYYVYSDPYSGEQHVFEKHEVMHFKTWFSFDGILGEPVRNILKYTIDGTLESQNFMNNLYKQGLTASMALQYTDNIDEARLGALQAKYEKKFSGAKNAGRIVPVPYGFQLVPVKMNLTDAQFFELRKYSALQIAAAFGIKPNQINNYEKSSYANSETQQLAFLVDTMAFRLKMYEEEINAVALLPAESKNGYFYKFNEKAILRQDSKSQMEALKGAVNNGIYTPNEARMLLDRPRMEGGDILMVNGNYIPITDVGKQYGKGGDGNGAG